MRPRSRCVRSALTLLEVLVATMLATIMVAVLFRVLHRTIHAQNIDLDRHPIVSPMAIEMVHRDLTNARGILADQRQWTLAGMFEPSHRPRIIRYEVRTIEAVPTLVRIDGEQTLQIIRDVAAITILPLVVVVEEDPGDDEPTLGPAFTGGLPPSPSVFGWQVVGVDGADRASGTVWSGND